jgi:hypothetical protein
VQPVLVDGGQFMPQSAVEIFDDSCVALHDPRPVLVDFALPAGGASLVML